jgi:hypothetical protein
MSFWKVDSKLAIAQKSVSVPSENGLNYTENGKIVIAKHSALVFAAALRYRTVSTACTSRAHPLADMAHHDACGGDWRRGCPLALP